MSSKDHLILSSGLKETANMSRHFGLSHFFRPYTLENEWLEHKNGGGWKMIFLFLTWVIFRFQVNFQGLSTRPFKKIIRQNWEMQVSEVL